MKKQAITDWLYKLFQVVIVEAFEIISSFFIGFKVWSIKYFQKMLIIASL